MIKKMYAATVVSWVSAYGYLNITRDFGPHGPKFKQVGLSRTKNWSQGINVGVEMANTVSKAI
jgi:hypothetical protein